MKDLILFTILAYPIYVILTNGPDIPLLIVIITLILYMVYFSQLKNYVDKKHKDKAFMSETKRLINLLIHDFKVPVLAQLRGAELLQNETLGTLNEEQKILLEEITHSCNYVLDMISMSSNIYQIDNCKYELVYENFNLSDTIISSFDKFSKEIKEKQINISYKKIGNETMINADKTEINKVITNMLLNAINHSAQGGRIDIKTFADDKKIIMSISGMKLGADTNYSTIGYDIGMYLSKKIIESHNGKIYIPEDKKSTNIYTFVLPKNLNAKSRVKCKKLCIS